MHASQNRSFKTPIVAQIIAELGGPENVIDVDLAHQADMLALRAQQLADDIDLDGETCSDCGFSLRACCCCHACKSTIDADGYCGCPDADDEMSEEDYRIMDEFYESAAPQVQTLQYDADYYSEDPAADLAQWRAQHAPSGA